MKKKSPKLPILPIEDLAAVLQGRGRYIDHLKHMYTDVGKTGTHIHICNYKLETTEEGHLTLPPSVNAISLVLENCEFNSLETKFPYSELSIVNCKFKNFQATEGIIQKLNIRQSRTKIESLTIKDSLVYNLEADANFEELIYVGKTKPTHCIATLHGEIDTLLLNETDYLEIQGTPLIRNCKIFKASYPFQHKKVIIFELTIINLTSTYLNLSGLFGKVNVAHFNGNLELSNFTCIFDCQFRNSSANATIVNISDSYIGGELLFSRCTPNLYAVNADGESEYLYIDQLVIQDSMKDLLIKNIDKAPIHINFLSFINIHVGKDQQWTLQGLNITNLSFQDFRNAGTGNIINVVGGTFNFLKRSFEELTKLALDNKLNGSFFREACNIIDAAPLSGTFNLYSSDLGKLNFIDSDFSNFRLHYYSTKLNEIFLAGSILPRKVGVMGPGSGSAHQQVKIANTQLKKLHEQHGDLVAANEYFANEINLIMPCCAGNRTFGRNSHCFSIRYPAIMGKARFAA